ncbi:MAG: hypothetical protein Q8O94_02970 [bacterium]|nr:hypothetical protein [bacterium]
MLAIVNSQVSAWITPNLLALAREMRSAGIDHRPRGFDVYLVDDKGQFPIGTPETDRIIIMPCLQAQRSGPQIIIGQSNSQAQQQAQWSFIASDREIPESPFDAEFLVWLPTHEQVRAWFQDRGYTLEKYSQSVGMRLKGSEDVIEIENHEGRATELELWYIAMKVCAVNEGRKDNECL